MNTEQPSQSGSTEDQAQQQSTSISEAPAIDSADTPHQHIGMAIVAYIIFFIPLLTDAKNDPYVKYHVRQGLVLFLAWLIVSIVMYVPPIMFVAWILHLVLLVLFVIGIVHAATGKEEPLPVIGSFAEHFHL